MNFLSVIEAKRDGQPLAADQIQEFIDEFTAGNIPNYQMAALLMAIYFRGLNPEETRALTLAMRDSGHTLKFPQDKRPLVDKHSTGGVGDKVSLPLVPLLACLGFRVPMISGRGLGITGGTLDKLESIPGFKTALTSEQIVDTVQEIGCVICGPTERMVPGDKMLYALRDVTATVPSIPLIVSSVLSKKLAESLDALVLDVKIGAAAFIKDRPRARELARTMVALGTQYGVKTRALLTWMDVPLGRAAGNWLEVKETVDCLESRGPEDLRGLVLDCAAHLLVQTRKTKTLNAARQKAGDCLASGAPRKKWNEMLIAQGADIQKFNDKLALDHTAPAILELKCSKNGFISRCDARVIGEVVRDLGGGRLTKESTINHDVGIDRLKRPGEAVQRGSMLARIHAADFGQAATACERLKAAFAISHKAPRIPPLVCEVITPE